MIVLLHAYQKGFSAMQVAVMFSFYEVRGCSRRAAACLRVRGAEGLGAGERW